MKVKLNGSNLKTFVTEQGVSVWSEEDIQVNISKESVPTAPVITYSGLHPNNGRPYWTWVSGGGAREYYYDFEGSDPENGVITNAEFYCPDHDVVTPGQHILRVKERTVEGMWSDFATASFDIAAVPTAPIITYGGLQPQSGRPFWTWVSGGGAREYYYDFDGIDYEQV